MVNGDKYFKNLYKVDALNDFRQLVYQGAKKYPNNNAFVLKDRNITYRQFESDYKSLCTGFLMKGYANKRIAVAGANSYEWILSYLCAATVGVVVPIDKELDSRDIADFILAGECSAVMSDADILNDISGLLNESIDMFKLDSKDDNSVNRLIQQGHVEYSSGATDIDTMKIDAQDMSILIFTSGTTGNSKGVCLSQKNICSNIRSIAKIVKVDSTRHALSILPLHHTYEATIGHLLLLFGGGTISYCDGLKFIAKNIEQYHPSVVIAVPRLLDMMLNKIEKSTRASLPEKYTKKGKDLTFSKLLDTLPFYIRAIVKKKVKTSLGGKLDMLIVGAAAVKPEVVQAFCKLGIKTYQGYGLTETSPLLTGNNDFYLNAYSAGLPIPGVDVKIYEPNEEGIGEIIAKGENIMLGYYKDEKATSKVMKDGYFHTGDLGKMDEKGFLFITGRKKNVIVTQGGKNIYPEELEERLALEAVVLEALILGVSDTRGNTTVKARIFPDISFIRDYLHDSMPSINDVHKVVQAAVDRVNEKLPGYKRIIVVEVLLDELEKTTTQKIKRYGTNYAV